MKSHLSIYIIRRDLEDLIDEFTNSKITRNYLNILEKQGYLTMDLILKYTKDFTEELKKRISEEDYKIVCGGKKDNRKFLYNPIVLLNRLEREKIKINENPTFSSFTNSLDTIIENLNKNKAWVKYPYSIVLIFNGNMKEAYEIPIIRIPEAYFLLIYNKDNPILKIPPIKNGKFLNEFEIEMFSYPKEDLTKVYIEGYQDLGTFRIFSNSEFDRIQRMRKVKYKRDIYFSVVLGRSPLQSLYILNLLENERNGKQFYLIVPDPSLLKIVSGIYKSVLVSNRKIQLPVIFTYLMIHAEINKRKEEGMNSFYKTKYITKEKLDKLYDLLSNSMKHIKSLEKVKMMSAVF